MTNQVVKDVKIEIGDREFLVDLSSTGGRNRCNPMDEVDEREWSIDRYINPCGNVEGSCG